jgi:hypothetical protein
MTLAQTAPAEPADYLREIRARVCSRCTERLPGGPPCAAAGIACGLEHYLPRLVAAVHRVESDRLEPYVESIHRHVCQGCSFYASIDCPCPMNRLLAPIVQAVKTVDLPMGSPD